MGRTDPATKATRSIRNFFILQTVAVTIASVMAFGLIEVWVNVMVYKSSSYGSEYMLGMILPTAIAMSAISTLNLRESRKQLRLILGGKAPEKVRVTRKCLPACFLGIVSAAFFLLIELVGRPVTGSLWSYPPGDLAGMAVSMGLIMTVAGIAVMREAAIHIIRILMDTIRSTAAVHQKWLEALFLYDGTRIISRLKRWLGFLSAGIVVASVMAFGLTDFVANVWMGQNPQYNPVKMIGMILPMGLILGLASYGILLVASRYTTRLLRGIERVAEGRFDTRLNEAHAGPFREVFVHFNRMCEELQGVQTLRDDFINDFSHEFKTPITSISGFAKLLLEESVTEEERRHYLRIIADESLRLADMASGALMISKLESQQYITERENYSLDEQMRECAIFLSPQWTKKRIDLGAELQSARFTGNADLMVQVWINLISNAVKYTPEGGKISLGLKLEDGWLVASVADTGKGMSGEERERAFEKYYQGNGASKGLGLGLAIVKRIVELHGGRVDAAGEPGKGSTFTVRLPA